MFIPLQAGMLWYAVFDPNAGQSKHLLLLVGVGLMLAITSTVVLVAQSRSAWVALTLGLTGMCVVEFRRIRLPAMLFLIGGIALLAVLWPVGAGDWLVQQAWTASPGEASWATRMELWSRGLWTIAEYPLTGTGMNIFRRMAWHSFQLLRFEYGQDIGHAHHAYIQVALELGLPGLVSYLAVLFAATGSGWLTYRGSSNRLIRHIALASVTGVAVHAIWGFADAVALGAKQSFLWWSVLALVVTIAILDRNSGLPGHTQESQLVPDRREARA
jgi:putative inorganic carbon (HCO3(-)) transporter